MAPQQAVRLRALPVDALEAPPGTLRLSGEGPCPRWRGVMHQWAAVAAVPAGTLLVVRRPSISVALYVCGLVACFTVSASYHRLPIGPGTRRRLRQADHATIYLYTAASITPFCRYAVGGRLGTAVTLLAWAGALAGVALKVHTFDRAGRIGGWLYMLLGWSTVVTLPRVLHHLDAQQLALLAGVGACYTGGAVVLFTRRPDPRPEVFGYHEVWHAAVVAASACYFLLVWGLVG